LAAFFVVRLAVLFAGDFRAVFLVARFAVFFAGDFRVDFLAVVFLVVLFAPALLAVVFFDARLAATERFAGFLAVVDFAATCAS
jgi:hypothetical protein